MTLPIADLPYVSHLRIWLKINVKHYSFTCAEPDIYNTMTGNLYDNKTYLSVYFCFK